MKLVLLFLLLLPFFSQAQKLKLNEYDKFIKLRRMETLPVTVKGDDAGKMALSFSSVGADFYLQLNGSGIGTYIIDANDKLVLQFDKDSALTIPSKGYQNYDISGDEITYHHSYVLSLIDLERLSRNNLVAIRKSHADKFDDISVTKENADKVKNLSTFFVDELKRSDVLKKQTMVTPPGFPGGYEVWNKFLKRNLKMPIELEKGGKKTVIVQFVVKPDGSVSDITIVQSQGASYDNEVLRVLNRMPKWKSALENDRPTEAVVTQAVAFSKSDSSVSAR